MVKTLVLVLVLELVLVLPDAETSVVVVLALVLGLDMIMMFRILGNNIQNARPTCACNLKFIVFKMQNKSRLCADIFLLS